MKRLVITGHPYDGSYNHALVEALLDYDNVSLINLIEDEFDPVMRAQDLKGFSQGVSFDPLVKKYQDLIMSHDQIIIVTPIWWSHLPAIYKGFIDKVMLKGFAYDEENRLLKGKLTHADCIIVSTSQAPNFYLKLFAGNPLRILRKRVFKDLGFKSIKTLNLGSISTISHTKRTQFIQKLKQLP